MKKKYFLLLLTLALACSTLQAKANHKTFLNIKVYIDPSNYFYYYYTFNYMRKALEIDEMSRDLHSLSDLRADLEFRNTMPNEEVPEIYFIAIYERNLEKYEELLEYLSAHNNLLLWVISAEGDGYKSPIPDIALDATSSASSKEVSLQDFRSEILPKLLTMYIEKTRNSRSFGLQRLTTKATKATSSSQ